MSVDVSQARGCFHPVREPREASEHPRVHSRENRTQTLGRTGVEKPCTGNCILYPNRHASFRKVFFRVKAEYAVSRSFLLVPGRPTICPNT